MPYPNWGGTARSLLIDVRDVSALPQRVEEAAALFEDNKIDILVNSAGVVTKHDFWNTDEKEYDSIMDTNAKGTFFMSQAVGKQMVEKHIQGHILNVTSSSALRPAWTPYQMSKWAVKGLTQSGFNNFTIIRPYITYYNNRLQLGIFEKEIWLQRALDDKKIVFSRNIASKYTTLTYGYDVALRIADLVGKDCALGKAYHITTEECIKWEDVLECYLDVVEQYTGKHPEVCWTEKSDPHLEKTNYYQIHCDREYNRRFSNAKIQTDSGEQQAFMETKQGLEKCLTEFLNGEKRFQFRDWKEEAVLDRISGDISLLKEIPGIKNKVKYVVYRYIFNV